MPAFPVVLPKYAPTSVFGATALLVAWTYFNGELFGYHATCMATGFLVFMGQGIVIANQGVTLKGGPQRLQLFQQHMALQVCGWVLIAGGFYAIYANKKLHGKPHFMTWHAQLGVLVLVWALVFTPLLGVGAFKWLGLHNRLPEHLQASTKMFHRLNGTATYGAAVMVVLLGMATPGIDKGLSTSLMKILAVACGALVVNSYLLKGPAGYSGVSTEISMEPMDMSASL